jgi:V/A-type H+/Na+-transporting ATPase subunit E
MEVVKSGDALEKQVLEDARAKASRVLTEAERECASVREEWQRKTDADIRRLEAERDRRVEAVRSELAASLPLDFMRARLSYIQATLDAALKDFFAGLSAKDLAVIIGNLLRRIPSVFDDKDVVVFASGITPTEARQVVEGTLPGVRVQGVKEMEQGPFEENRDVGIILETTDARVRFRGTMRELSAQLLEQNREELAEALLGRDV